jgi:hypothetical protein
VKKSWNYTMADGLEATILLRFIDHEFAIKEIYQKVDWKQVTAPQSAHPQ